MAFEFQFSIKEKKYKTTNSCQRCIVKFLSADRYYISFELYIYTHTHILCSFIFQFSIQRGDKKKKETKSLVTYKKKIK